MGLGGGGRTRVSPGSPSAPLPGCQSTARPGLQDHGSPASGDSPRQSWAGGPAWGQGGGVSRGSRPHPTQAQPSPPGHIMSPEPPNTPSLPTPSPKWTGLSSSPERPWVKPGEGGRPGSVGEALGPQGLLGPVSPGPLSAQSPGLPCDLPHTPRRASFPPSHALPLSPQGAWAPLPHPTVPGLPEDSGVGWGCRPKADSAPLLLICVTRANPPPPGAPVSPVSG